MIVNVILPAHMLWGQPMNAAIILNPVTIYPMTIVSLLLDANGKLTAIFIIRMSLIIVQFITILLNVIHKVPASGMTFVSKISSVPNKPQILLAYT